MVKLVDTFFNLCFIEFVHLCLQDDGSCIMEDDETDYVDIPIRVVTQSDNT